MYTKRQQALWLSSTESVQTRLVNYVWNVAAATAAAAAVVAKTTMLINSFPHPAVTGSDLAATLTENKTINVTCRSKSASVYAHKQSTHRQVYIIIHVRYIRVRSVQIYIQIYTRRHCGYYDDKSYPMKHTLPNTIRNRRRRRDKLLLYFPRVGVLVYGMYVFVTSRALFSAGDIIIIICTQAQPRFTTSPRRWDSTEVRIFQNVTLFPLLRTSSVLKRRTIKSKIDTTV